MRGLVMCLLLVACRSDSAPVVERGTPADGLRERAIAFLEEHMPEGDRGALAPEFLAENLELALQARREFAWAASVPLELFLNDVLPYAVFDEARDPWRGELLELSRPLVVGATTASEAAQALNRGLFEAIGVHYDTARERPNQSLLESRRSGKASCTGLSIALVEACRSVGIPARAVGTPRWSKKPGNHTWVEIWDGDWHFAGADEYDAGGLDRGWFVGDAADARADVAEHRIYATSWRRSSIHFPLAWSRTDRSVAAVNVTQRYAREPKTPDPAEGIVFVRVFDRRGGERIAVDLELLDRDGRAAASDTSRVGTSDMNDMPRFSVPSGETRVLRLTRAGMVRLSELRGPSSGSSTVELHWSELSPTVESKAEPLTRAMLDSLLAAELRDRREQLRVERTPELTAQAVTLGDKSLRWLEKSFGDAPEGKRSLWISMHGGGGAPSEVNDRQWKNQLELYQPIEGIYLAPRAPTDTWNLWHEGHIDPLFARMIEDFVALRGVDPDRVYLLGYSAGGDGVWQLAPRMADRFAAAAMMAGHPNEASLLGLRNLPFAILMGGDDGAYDRNRVASERSARLADLRAADPGGYEHFVRIYEGLGHWMKKRDAEALPWMAERTRTPWPRKVVWFQDDVVHERFYWLGRAPGKPRAGETIVAEVEGQTIRILAGEVKDLRLWLSDELVDLDRELIVEVDGARIFEGRIARDAKLVRESLAERFDPRQVASGVLDLVW